MKENQFKCILGKVLNVPNLSYSIRSMGLMDEGKNYFLLDQRNLELKRIELSMLGINQWKICTFFTHFSNAVKAIEDLVPLYNMKLHEI